MERRNTEVNYHNTLSDFSVVFDEVIKLFQEQYNDGKLEQNWKWTLLLLPIKNIASFSSVVKIITSIMKLLLPLIGGTVLATFLTSFWIDNQILFLGIGIVSFIVTYLILLQVFYLPKMLNIKDQKNFHIAAYRDKRYQEFTLFKRAFLFRDFSFKSLHDYVNGVLTYQEKESKSVIRLIEDFDKQRADYKQQLEDLDLKHNAAINEYKQVLNKVNNDYKEQEKVTNYLIEFLSHINVILFRIENGLFSLSDLDFLTGITIYEKSGESLRKVPNGDHGTTGASRAVIPLNDSKFDHYSAVRAVIEKSDVPIFQRVRDGYIIVSYRMKMDLEGHKVWVFNFHVNTDTNEKEWNLLLNNDILSISEVYRLFHALCLLILKSESGTEVSDHASS